MPTDSGYDTLAVTAAILDQQPEMEEDRQPEMTSYVDLDLWTRQPESTRSAINISSQRQSEEFDVRTKQRRFPRMGQSCLHRASPLRPFTETAIPRRHDDDDETAIYSRPRLTGYTALPHSDTTGDVGTTAV